MKKRIIIFSVLALTSVTIGCKKVAGPGGTSSIKGNVQGTFIDNNKPAENEVTSIICNHADGVGGSILDNSDYFLLNTPGNTTNYYVWYENTNWLGQDPSLQGRTAIKVTYSNNESNVTIATNTAAAILAIAGGDFDVVRVNDVITLTNKTAGEVSDANDVNTPFVIDILNQGKNSIEASANSYSGPVIDEQVYIIYGDGDFYGENVRTDGQGNYQFVGLAKGNYRVFTYSIDTLASNFTLKQIETSVEITKNKQVVNAPDLNVVLK